MTFAAVFSGSNADRTARLPGVADPSKPVERSTRPLITPGEAQPEVSAPATVPLLPSPSRATIGRSSPQPTTLAEHEATSAPPGNWCDEESRVGLVDQNFRDLIVLLRMAVNRGFELPAAIRPIIEAAVYPGVDFVCQAVSRHGIAYAASQEMVTRAQEACNVPVDRSLEGTQLLIAHELYLTACISHGISMSAATLWTHHERPLAQTFASVAMELCSLYVHGCLLLEMRQARRSLINLKGQNGFMSATHTLTEAHRKIELQNAVVSKQMELKNRLDWRGQAHVEIVLGFLTWMAVRQMFHKPMLPLPASLSHRLPQFMQG